MFLTHERRSHHMRRLGGLRHVPNDDGSALIAVIGLIGLAAIVALAISASTVHALGFSTATRAGVQAEAAAEAGIDYAAANLSNGDCEPSYKYQYQGSEPGVQVAPSSDPQEGAEPGSQDDVGPQDELGNDSQADTKSNPEDIVRTWFTVSVSYKASSDAGWQDGCPTGADVTQLRLVSTGNAPQPGVAGQSAGNTRTVEAVYAVTPAQTAEAAAGAALYSYGAVSFGGSGTLQTVKAAIPNVYVKHGGIDCSGGSQVAGNLVTDDGDVTASGSCAVGGNVWASGKIGLSGGITVGGNVVAGSDLGFVDGTVSGSAWASGVASLGDGSHVADITAKTLNLTGTKVTGNAWASGLAAFTRNDLEVSGNLTAQSWSYPSYVKSFGNGSIVAGTVTAVPGGPGSGPATPPRPAVPGWLDYPYDPAMWPGFIVKTLSGNCTSAALQSLANSFGGQPGVIDARSCADITLTGDDKFSVSGDLAIFAPLFKFSGGSGTTTPNGPHQLWLITPDNTPDGQPTCSGGVADTEISGDFTPDPRITAMLYTPCKVSEAASGNWYGQFYASKADLTGAAKLAYVPIGLPGADLSSGTLTGNGNQGTSAVLLGARLSIRDVSN